MMARLLAGVFYWIFLRERTGKSALSLSLSLSSGTFPCSSNKVSPNLKFVDAGHIFKCYYFNEDLSASDYDTTSLFQQHNSIF